MANADALSRLPMSYNTGIEYDSINSLNTLTFPLSVEDIKEAMKNDACITQIYNSIITGNWPTEKTGELQNII
ncbi:hypothetical protein CVS40_12028 [Lucilia cuprina]|nr:hypothetical protein CVS40_12028 [Lucilia cuprina]